jgi:predicted negative regulator of RcsB-dependent stress response
MADTPKVPVAVLEYEPSGFEQSLIKHKSKLILVGVLALAGTAGYWGYKLWKEATNKSAAVDFVRADSVPDLKAVAEKHSGKPAGGNALVLAAEKLSAERPGEAIDLLKSFLDKYPDHPLRDLASFRIAEYYVLSGDTGSAEKEYEAVSKAGTAFSSFALLRLGDMKWAAGDTAKAQELYDTILKSPAMIASPVRPIAKERVDKDLKAKPPVLVEYKEEPPATPPGKPFDGISLTEPGDAPAPPPTPEGRLLPYPSVPGFVPETPPTPAPSPAPTPDNAPTPGKANAAPAPIEPPKPAAPPASAPADSSKPAAPAPAETTPAGKNAPP